MTDEERKQLCADLRSEGGDADELLNCLHGASLKAANEIERLAKRVAELEALPPDNARWAIHDNHWTFR